MEKSCRKRSCGRKSYLWRRGQSFTAGFHVLFGILVTISLPLSLKIHRKEKYLEAVEEHYLPAVIIFISPRCAGVCWSMNCARYLARCLRRTALYRKMWRVLGEWGDLKLFIAAKAAMRCVVYLTIAMPVIILVFIIAGMFSKVLAMVFEKPCATREENGNNLRNSVSKLERHLLWESL